jgi:CRISPR system Cascade subunit CasD
MRHLLLRLEGPLMAFGDVAVDETRPTARFPTLSMVTGLIANALGLDRANPEDIQELQDSMTIASRLDRPGNRERDYQTALLNSKDTIWTTRGRVAERGGASSGEFTAQMEKGYLADASITVAIGMPQEMLDRVISALDKPFRPIFLGRIGCPPSCPVMLGAVDATDVLDALRKAPASPDANTTMEAQWPCGLRGGTPFRTVSVTDVRDWKKGFHGGTRSVVEGKIELEEAA